MRFNRGLAQLYRKNGYLFVAKDIYNGVYDVFHQTNSGAFHKIDTLFTKSEAVKEAKSQAMIRKLGFDPAIDIVD